jgi:hypothetical protein
LLYALTTNGNIDDISKSNGKNNIAININATLKAERDCKYDVNPHSKGPSFSTYELLVANNTLINIKTNATIGAKYK